MTAAQEITPTVTIAGDKSIATLEVPPGCDPSGLTEAVLIELITVAGVEVTEATTAVIKEFAQSPPPTDQAVSLDVAFATPVIHGDDGVVVWHTDTEDSDDGKDKGDKTTTAPPADNIEEDNISYYDRCSFDMVETGDVVGKVLPPETGQDGRDVTGATIPAKAGKEAKLTIDESIMKQADGSLVAQQDGVLHRDGTKAQIRKHIQIRNYVDFSTGNLDFDGDITIDRGVRDCFLVKATGNIEVKGLIEAATIEAGKDLAATGGFAGRERGHVLTGGCLRGKYLDNVHGKVKKDLCIDREVINCEIAIDGKIISPRGAIIGGSIVPTGEVEIATLGSGAGVITEIVIGSIPTLEPFAREFTRIVEQLTAELEKLNEEQDTINRNTAKGRMTATDKERQTEIMFEQSESQTNLDKAQRTLDSIQEAIKKRRRVDVTVYKTVFSGVTFILDERKYKMTQEMTGPIRFYMDGKVFVYRVGDSPNQPVSQVADIQAIIPDKEAA